MKNLYKVLSVWENLENSYDKMKEKLGTPNRLDFLYKICGKNGDSDSIDSIKLRLKAEMDTYTEEEFASYSKLISILDAVKQLISKEGIEEISNLDMAMSLALSYDKNIKNNSRELPSTFFSSMRNYKFENPIPLQPLDLYNKSGIFSDSYGYKENGELYYNNLDNTKFTDIITFTNMTHLEEFLTYYSENRDKVPKFHAKVFAILDRLNTVGKLNLDYVYVDKRYFEVKDNYVFFNTGKVQKQKIINTLDIGVTCYVCNMRGKLETFPVVFVE